MVISRRWDVHLANSQPLGEGRTGRVIGGAELFASCDPYPPKKTKSHGTYIWKSNRISMPDFRLL